MLVLEGLLGKRRCGCGFSWGHGHWWWRFWGVLSYVNSRGGRHLAWVVCSKTWPHPTACRLQCWDASSQTTKRVGTLSHPSADRLPENFWSPWPPLDTPLDTALPTSGQALAPPTRKPAQASRLASPTRGQTQKQDYYSRAVCGTESTNTEI